MTGKIFWNPRESVLLAICKQWIADGSPREAAVYAKVLAHRALDANPFLRDNSDTEAEG